LTGEIRPAPDPSDPDYYDILIDNYAIYVECRPDDPAEIKLHGKFFLLYGYTLIWDEGFSAKQRFRIAEIVATRFAPGVPEVIPELPEQLWRFLYIQWTLQAIEEAGRPTCETIILRKGPEGEMRYRPTKASQEFLPKELTLEYSEEGDTDLRSWVKYRREQLMVDYLTSLSKHALIWLKGDKNRRASSGRPKGSKKNPLTPLKIGTAIQDVRKRGFTPTQEKVAARLNVKLSYLRKWIQETPITWKNLLDKYARKQQFK
jgi:hypothetical protein